MNTHSKSVGPWREYRGNSTAGRAGAGRTEAAWTAFTLIELLVALGTLGLCVVTLAPAVARTKPGSQAVQCLNNNRQLCLAWRMYADDNHEFLTYASDDGTGSMDAMNVYAWTRSHLDFSGNGRANWDITVDIQKSPLWPFFRNASAEKCPADHSYVWVNSVAKPRVRTMAMNQYLGGFATASGLGNDGGGDLPTLTGFTIR